MSKPSDEMGPMGAFNVLLATLGGVSSGQEAVDATDAAVLAQEKRGQQNLVNSSQIPRRINPKNGKALLEAAGVKFLGADPNDDLFQNVELPSGWKKVATDHDMHSNLVDETGKVRAGIFFKAAFYDRRADMTVVLEDDERKDVS